MVFNFAEAAFYGVVVRLVRYVEQAWDSLLIQLHLHQACLVHGEVVQEESDLVELVLPPEGQNVLNKLILVNGEVMNLVVFQTLLLRDR